MTSRKLSFFLLSIFVLTIAWTGLWSLSGVDAHHDGIILKPISDVLHGQMLYRDSFNQYGALTILFQVPVCWLFGCNTISLHLFTVLCYGIIAVLLTWIALRFIRPFFVIVGVLFPFFILMPYYWMELLPWSSVFSLLFSLPVLMYFLKIIGPELSKRQCVLLGSLSILPFWFRQPLGLVMPAIALPLLLQCWVNRYSLSKTLGYMAAFTLGISLTCLPILLWILYNGALNDFWIQNFQFASRFPQAVSGNAYAKESWKPWSALFYKMLLVEVVGFCCWLFWEAMYPQKRNSSWVALCGLALVALVSLHQYYPLACISHMYHAGVISFILWGILLEKAWNRWPRKLPRVVFLAFFILLPTWQFFSVSFLKNEMYPRPDWRLQDLHRITEPGPTQNMFVHDREYELFWKPFLEHIRNMPEEYRDCPILNLTPDALYNLYFPNQENWHPMYVNWGKQIYTDYNGKMLTRLQKKDCVVLCSENTVDEVRKCGYVPVKICGDSFTFYRHQKPLYIAIPPKKNSCGVFQKTNRLLSKQKNLSVL